jgi:hypothetical protein
MNSIQVDSMNRRDFSKLLGLFSAAVASAPAARLVATRSSPVAVPAAPVVPAHWELLHWESGIDQEVQDCLDRDGVVDRAYLRMRANLIRRGFISFGAILEGVPLFRPSCEVGLSDLVQLGLPSAVAHNLREAGFVQWIPKPPSMQYFGLGQATVEQTLWAWPRSTRRN